MSKRVLLGKIDGSDYGLLVSRAGVDVTNANADQLIFDSRQKGYGQLIFQETITVTRDSFTGSGITSNSVTRTFSNISIPNPIVIVYGNVFVKVVKGDDTNENSNWQLDAEGNDPDKKLTFRVPYVYPSFRTAYPLATLYGIGATAKITPASQSIKYAVIRGPV